MRFTVILIALLLLPVMVAVQVWDYAGHHEPKLEKQARAILQKEGIRAATVDLRYLDLSVTGDAPDAESLQRATTALENLSPVRLVHNTLTILAEVSAQLQDQTLTVKGWLPPDCSPAEVSRLLTELRPDLKIDTSRLRTSPQVRWPEGEGPPLSSESLVIKAAIAGLRVAPALSIAAEGQQLKVVGVMPDQPTKDEIVSALAEVAPRFEVDASALRTTHYIEPASFARSEVLVPFLRSFYSAPVPGSFSIASNSSPKLKAAATPTLQSEWLALLRPLTGGTPVEMDLTLYPSLYHVPGYRPTTPLPAEKIEALSESLSGFYVVFETASTTISTSARERLAGLVPTLLAAGPNLRLVVGGHPEPGGQPATQRRLALARAQQVVSYLIEQGAPTSDIEAVAFDAMPVGTAGAVLPSRSVEILIK